MRKKQLTQKKITLGNLLQEIMDKIPKMKVNKKNGIPMCIKLEGRSTKKKEKMKLVELLKYSEKPWLFRRVWGK